MRRVDLLAAGAIVFAVVIVYHGALPAYFFDDDFQWLVGTWSFRPSHLIWPGGENHFFRPVIDLYFATLVPLFGDSPRLFHAASIALHAATGLVLFALAQLCSGSRLFGFVTALFFVVQPAHTDAVAWIGALAEPLTTLFGCTSVFASIRHGRGGAPSWRRISLGFFAAALLAHESSVMFLPLLLLADWAFVGDLQPRAIVRRYAPYAILTVIYLAVDLSVNRTHSVVEQGTYAFGWHAVPHALDYIVSMAVGRRNVANYALIAGVIAACLASRRPRLIFAVGWLLLTLLPFVFFTWPNTSRYAYLPAVGFSMLMAEGTIALAVWLARPFGDARRPLILASLVAIVALRSGLFAVENVDNFTQRTDVYRQYARSFREIHGELPRGAVVVEDPPVPHRFAEALLQWQYGDPALRLIGDNVTKVP